MNAVEFLLKFYFGAGLVCAIALTQVLRSAVNSDELKNEVKDSIPKEYRRENGSIDPAIYPVFFLGVLFCWPMFINAILLETFKKGR